MGGPTYTVEQLQHLRNSPLVQKPDGLPSIEQWMDVPVEQNNNNTNNTNNNRRPRSGNHGDSTATGDTRPERPSLVNVGSMGHFGRRASMQPDDNTVLGPPKLSFTSARRDAKTMDNSEKRGIISIDGDHLGDRFPSSNRQRGDRWGRDREGDTSREKPGFTNSRRGGREEGEGWTNVKGRKSLGQEDFDRGFGRNGDREKAHKDGEGDLGDGTARRTGTGRDKFERWGRRDDTTTKEVDNPKSATTGGWRDRERDRERERDRDWHRGGTTKAEEDPEWMDTPRLPKEKKQAHTQEEFQRWKELMKAKDAPATEKEDTKGGTPAPEGIPLSGNPLSKPLATPGTAEMPMGNLFGNWGKGQLGESNATTNEPTTVKPKPAKKSRFMNMFDKPEEPAVSAVAGQGLAPTPGSPPPPQFSPEGGNADEDKQGFQRILQMLGGTNISAPQGGPPGVPPGPPPGMGLQNNGPMQGGIPLDLHQASSTVEERPDSRMQRQQDQRSLEQKAILENLLGARPPGPESRGSQSRFTSASPDNSMLERFAAPRPDSSRPSDDFPIQQPPSRNSNAQDAHLYALLASRAREETNRDPQVKQRERDFLLTLMQQPSRATPPQMLNQGLPRPPSENQNMQFFDQGQRPPQGQPKGRGGGPPPGFMEDPRFIAENEMVRREQRLRELQQQQQEAMRAKERGLPMGFNPNEDPMLQRRNTAGEIPRQMTNMGIPSQPLPDMQFMGGRQPGMPPTPNERSNIAPPPGFSGPGGMRQPPPGLGGPGGPGGPVGLGGPQQMPPFSTGNTPLHPPGFGPPSAGMRGGGPGMFPGAPGLNQMPPGPPQGYFPPQPFGGPPDPRMMMGRPEFEQFGGPGPRQGGRPPNMY